MKTVSLKYKNLRLVWEHIGEGWNGHYDESNPEDNRLYRFTLYRNDEQVHDCSYCTRVTETATKIELIAGLVVIMRTLLNASHMDKACQEFSWTNSEDLKQWVKNEFVCPHCKEISYLDNGESLYHRICNGCGASWKSNE